MLLDSLLLINSVSSDHLSDLFSPVDLFFAILILRLFQETFILFYLLLLCWVRVLSGIYKSSYNISNISYLVKQLQKV
jgi:hypothetical protein